VSGCNKCDVTGGAKTYANQASLPINGKVRCIDWCIHHIVAALNAGGVQTVASCCGHGKKDGIITLSDGRTLTITVTPNPVAPKEYWANKYLSHLGYVYLTRDKAVSGCVSGGKTIRLIEAPEEGL